MQQSECFSIADIQQNLLIQSPVSVRKAELYAGCSCSRVIVRWKERQAEVEEQVFHG